jgi:hypothetical protein
MTKYGMCNVFPHYLFKGTPNIDSAINKTEFYHNMLKDLQLKLYNSIEILDEFNGFNNYIHVKDKYGVCYIKAKSLREGWTPSIQSAIDKESYIKEMVRLNNTESYNAVLEWDFSEYNGSNSLICVKTKYGYHRLKYQQLIKTAPNILSCVDKLDYFKNNLKDTQPKLFLTIVEFIDYETTNSRAYILFKDKYGACKMRSDAMLNGLNPSIESAIDKNSYIKNMFKEVHGDKYIYDKVNYVKTKNEVIITCKIHGDFPQAPHCHISGKQGCPHCANELYYKIYNLNQANEKKDLFKSTYCKVYCIRCYNDTENFYKIGITKRSVADRFRCCMPYTYDICMEYETNMYDAIMLENELHSNHTRYYPHIKFKGNTECFTSYENWNSVISKYFEKEVWHE